jgi:hypothetical protein
MLRTLESSQGSRADAFLLEERDDSTAEGHHDGGDGDDKYHGGFALARSLGIVRGPRAGGDGLAPFRAACARFFGAGSSGNSSDGDYDESSASADLDSRDSRESDSADAAYAAAQVERLSEARALLPEGAFGMLLADFVEAAAARALGARRVFQFLACCSTSPPTPTDAL